MEKSTGNQIPDRQQHTANLVQNSGIQHEEKDSMVGK